MQAEHKETTLRGMTVHCSVTDVVPYITTVHFLKAHMVRCRLRIAAVTVLFHALLCLKV